MKVLFITKPFIIEPLGIMYLSSMLKSHGHPTDIVCIGNGEGVKLKVAEYKPDIVAYSIMTGDQYLYNGVNITIKRDYPGIFSIAGGPHPTFFPEMINDPVMTFDTICIGEGENSLITFLTLQGHINAQGFRFRNNCNGSKNENFPLCTNLDMLPNPDRYLVSKYQDVHNNPIKHLIASRGCPYNCTYCFNKSFAELYPNQQRVRFRSVKNVMNEIEELKENPYTKFIYFQDDTFILNKEWLREFSTQSIGLPFHCHVRANLINADTVKYLVAAGCYSVHIAIEAGNEQIRSSVLNRQMTNGTIIGAIKMLKNAGIKVMAQSILGLPGTTIENDLETLELNIACQPDYAWVSIFQPYPKTTLGIKAKEIGAYTGDFSDLHNNFFDSCPLNIPFEHKIQIENLQKLFALTVRNPSIYTSHLLQKMIKETDDTAISSYKEIYQSVRKDADKILYNGLIK
jgi:radical SAM superfamily enzyme YgiQ (UPF0313 family)